eukprot:gene1705-474_t
MTDIAKEIDLYDGKIEKLEKELKILKKKMESAISTTYKEKYNLENKILEGKLNKLKQEQKNLRYENMKHGLISLFIVGGNTILDFFESKQYCRALLLETLQNKNSLADRTRREK